MLLNHGGARLVTEGGLKFSVDKRGGMQSVQRGDVRCEQTEADTEQPIAAPAWSSYGTRPPLRNLCVLRTVLAAGSGFRRGAGILRGQMHLGSAFRAYTCRATTQLTLCHCSLYERQFSRHEFLAV